MYNDPRANYNVVLNSSHGMFFSPIYPAMLFSGNFTCRWIINVPSGHRIKLSFRAFHLGQGALDNCDEVDRVEVRDSFNDDDPAYGTFCGNVVPSPIYAVGPKMVVTFISYKKKAFQYFSARFDATSEGRLSVYFTRLIG